jgi:hypothetical protein
METQVKEVLSVQDAFDASDEELGITPVAEEKKDVKAEDTTVKVGETPKGEVEKTEIKPESKVETGEETAKTEVVAEKTWTELGLPQYDGLTKEQIAERVQFVNREYGKATNTVGELRKQINSVVSEAVKPDERKETKKSILEAMPPLSETETDEFNRIYVTEQNPVKAILQFAGEPIKQMIREELKNQVPKDLDLMVAKKTDEIKYNTFLSQHDLTDDSPEVVWMKQVDTEYLIGQNRPYEELFELSQMWKAKEEGAEQVYSLMKKHPTMTLKEAKTYIPKKTAQTVDTKKIASDVKKLDNANHTSKTVQKSDNTLQNFSSVHEAFDSVPADL